MIYKETPISLDRSICTNLADAEQREWLVANGIGGYAMGTVAGLRNRSYHGLLIAALNPPLDRTLLVSGLEETVSQHGQDFELFANRWHPDEVTPTGYRYIENFELDGTIPTWTFKLGDTLLQKQLWLQPNVNATYLRYTVLEANAPLEIQFKALANYRDHHDENQNTNMNITVEQYEDGLKITPPDAGAPFYILSNSASMEPQHIWYENLFLATEADRGCDPYDSDLLVGILHANLQVDESVTIVATTNRTVTLDGDEAYQARITYDESLITSSPLADAPAEIQQLGLAADQFIVQRETTIIPAGQSIIAGYPWFEDWGRDTMISLPGLTLVTGRPEVAAKILRTFAQFVDQGLLPNRFPDASDTPEYNTVDATLWYFQAIRAYESVTKDTELLRELFPVLKDIIEWHYQGTKHQIHVDPTDQLLSAGEPGTQLTWMDAKYNGYVVTPRIGKPIEVNALWFNALKVMVDFATKLDETKDSMNYAQKAAEVGESFKKFWNPHTGYCYDVLDGPDGHEALLRPNQLFAVSLPYSPLNKDQQKAVVDSCSQSLLTPYGLRSLAPDQPGYIGRYIGNTEQRDSSYHQGTVWAWLIGPFVEAHLRVYKDTDRARSFLEPLLTQHLREYGLGSVSEVFDGDMPYPAKGCPAQAWSVAELLRAWYLTNSQG